MVAKHSIEVSGTARQLNAFGDFPDIRDRYYEPPLVQLDSHRMPSTNLLILDQGTEGACTGFATAAALNLLRQLQGSVAPADGTSPRMLYEMAKIHDEWDGSGYEGSSVRGAIKGFYHNGVCLERHAPYVPGQLDWTLGVEQAKAARSLILGSYYRLRPILVDYHAALQQAGAIVVSAEVHDGWTNPGRTKPAGMIRQSRRMLGLHAFAIVGYDPEGFLVQNSWGPQWGGYRGLAGVAHWSYHDWAETIVDAWVMRLAVPTATAFELTHRVARSAGTELPPTKKPAPRRQDVVGHIIHLDDGRLVDAGTYGTPMGSLEETAKRLNDTGQSADRKYDHILFYAHGGVTDAIAAASNASLTREGFKRNRIYPIHFIWETGLFEELKDIVLGKMADRGGRAEGFPEAMDFLIEKLTAGIGRALWREMKSDAQRTFAEGAQGAEAVRTILSANLGLDKPYKFHLVGHSAGSNFVGEFVGSWRKLAPKGNPVENCFVLGAACTVEQYERQFRPALDRGDVRQLTIYNLSKERELDDTVGPYSKSLLHLVSKAFEDQPEAPLLGMEEFSASLAAHPKQTLLYTSGLGRKRTDAMSHGGYGTDLTTLNDILKVIRGADYKASLAFRKDELAGT